MKRKLINTLVPTSMKRIKLLGIEMDAATKDETIKWIDHRINNHQFTQHVVVNVAKLINMRNDVRLRTSVESCDIINIDGMGVVWGARLLGMKVPERVSGIDLFFDLLALASNRKYPIFLLGAKQEIVEKTVSVLQKRFNRLEISGYHHGYSWNDEEAVVKAVRTSGARLLFVAISSPKKEYFINQWQNQLGVDFVMGVGGTFDVIAGKVKRAPKWMQIAGLEWFYRLIQEPRRMWRRYLVSNSKFIWLLLKEKLQNIAGRPI